MGCIDPNVTAVDTTLNVLPLIDQWKYLHHLQHVDLGTNYCVDPASGVYSLQNILICFSKCVVKYGLLEASVLTTSMFVITKAMDQAAADSLQSPKLCLTHWVSGSISRIYWVGHNF